MKEKLYRLARNASQRAYSPYSGIRVGAAVLDDRGEIHTGVNIENASYGLTLCAERVAVSTAIASGATQIIAIAVALHDEGEMVEQFTPCGACLQFISEFVAPETRVLIEDKGDFAFRDLFPVPFAVS